MDNIGREAQDMLGLLEEKQKLLLKKLILKLKRILNLMNYVN